MQIHGGYPDGVPEDAVSAAFARLQAEVIEARITLATLALMQSGDLHVWPDGADFRYALTEETR